jgi:t-SNARE complex subunit (syntaxin)
LKRGYKISHPDTTEDEIEELLQNQKLDEDVYKKKISLSRVKIILYILDSREHS